MRPTRRRAGEADIDGVHGALRRHLTTGGPERLQRRRDAGEELNVTEKRYLLRNRNAAADLAGAVARLIDAQERLDELPASDPLRQLFEAPSVVEAARLLHRHPGRRSPGPSASKACPR